MNERFAEHVDCDICDEYDTAKMVRHNLDVIRAFVERVTVRYAQDKRYDDIQPYLHLMLDEIAVMEKEAE